MDFQKTFITYFKKKDLKKKTPSLTCKKVIAITSQVICLPLIKIHDRHLC